MCHTNGPASKLSHCVMTASTVTESTAVTLCYIAPIPRPSDTICPSAELVMRQNQSNMSHSITSSHESADMLLLLSAWLSVACPGGIVDGIGAAGGPGGGPAGGPGGPEAGPGRLLTVTGIITMRSRCVHHGRWQPPLSNGRHMTGYRSPVTY